MTAAVAPWPCERNVVESVVSYLSAEGWTIASIADTETRSPGVDIRAVRSDELLIVEAKGYPGTVYARGENKGKPKTHKARSGSAPLVRSGPIRCDIAAV